MTDVHNNSFYVKNYRSDRLRLRQKYGTSSSRLNSSESLHSDLSSNYPPVGLNYGLSSGLNSLAASTLDLTNISSNSNTNATLRSSSGYNSSSELGTSTSYPHSNHILNGVAGGYGTQSKSRAHSVAIAPIQTPKFTLFAAAVKLTARPIELTSFNKIGSNSRAASSLDIQEENEGNENNKSLVPARTTPRPYYQYQRTYSGGTRIRCASADPDRSSQLLAIESPNTLHVPVSNALMRYGRLNNPTLTPNNFSSSVYSGSRCGSADRFANTNGTTTATSMLSLASSLWSLSQGNNNSYTNIYDSAARLDKNNDLRRYTPVTELARNVSAHKWDQDDIPARNFQLGRSNSSLAIGSRDCVNDAGALMLRAPSITWSTPKLSREHSTEEKTNNDTFEVINEENSKGSDDSWREKKALVPFKNGITSNGYELSFQEQATLARVSCSSLPPCYSFILKQVSLPSHYEEYYLLRVGNSKPI